MLVLGINHSNDAAAAVAEAGRVTAASAEERFSRVKHDASFPRRAIGFVLGHHDRELRDLDAVAFFWNPIQQMDAPNARMVATPRSHLEYLYSLPNQLLGGADHSRLPYAQLTLPWPGERHQQLFFVNHHLCHAAHAFFETPFEEAAILTIDGYGERISTMIAEGRGTSIKPLIEIPFPHSLGSVYAAVTQFLGFRANADEGKVMGLASWGEPRYLDLFRRIVRCTDDAFEVDLSYFAYHMDRPNRFSERLVAALGEPRRPGAALEKRHEAIAASLQAVTEEVLLHLVAVARRRTGMRALCMAGGVALNCVANGRIVKEAEFERFFFQPACNDAGTSAGAALYVSHVVLGAERNPPPVKTDYLGPGFSDAQLRAALDRAGVSFRESTDPEREAAAQLARGRIVGRFAGRAEFGPRALGNRSILAPPGPAAVKDLINKRVKGREPFRPFAPSVLESACGSYFDSDVASPFMLRAYRTREEHLEALGAITHVDGTARVQTVNPQQNAGYAALIARYGDAAGHACVLNTSFNVRGEPIVNTPQDALKCFFTTDMDDLFLGPFALEKR